MVARAMKDRGTSVRQLAKQLDAGIPDLDPPAGVLEAGIGSRVLEGSVGCLAELGRAKVHGFNFARATESIRLRSGHLRSVPFMMIVGVPMAPNCLAASTSRSMAATGASLQRQRSNA
jgi:hypothetical protein